MLASLTTPNLGTALSEDRDRVHFAALRAQRRERVLQEMERRGLDACVLGREGNVRYVSGARRLWTAQTRPFSPTCVVVRSPQGVSLLTFSASYEGTPEEVGPDELLALTWDPANFANWLRSLPGFADAQRVGLDGLSPVFCKLFHDEFPTMELVGAEDMLRQVRRSKLPDEIVCLRTAAAIAEAALYAAATAVRPGAREKHLQAAFYRRMCDLGSTQCSEEGIFAAIDPAGDVPWLTGDRALDEGTLVALGGGVLWAGYEGSLARTWWCGTGAAPTARHKALHRRWDLVTSTVVEACRAGNSGADLRRAFESTGEPLPRRAVAYSLGLGSEGAIAGSGLSEELERAQLLEAGTVLGIRVPIRTADGAYLGQEMVLVTTGEPEVLTTLGHGPLAS